MDKIKNIVKELEMPLYLYDADLIKEKCRELKKNLSGIKLYYACKANTNLEIIKLIHGQGFDVETVSPGEINIARKAGIPTSQIPFTCSNISEKELVGVVKQGIRVHLDSLYQVETFGKNFSKRKDLREISVRLNLNIGAGHHSHVITGGPDSKFGIDISKIKELKILAKKYNLRITGLHQHIGSNVLSVPIFLKAMKALFTTALHFPDLRHLDFGGGFGVPYAPHEKKLNLKILGKKIKVELDNFTKKYGKKLEFSFEPGRYLVAEAGHLLVQVTDIKRNPNKTFVGVNSGMNHLVRHAMYDSYHEIINLNNPKGRKEKVTVAGNMCESGDVFAKNRKISKCRIGDILSIENAGAYGYVMASEYNSRPKPKEFLMSGNKIKEV